MLIAFLLLCRLRWRIMVADDLPASPEPLERRSARPLVWEDWREPLRGEAGGRGPGQLPASLPAAVLVIFVVLYVIFR